MVGSFSDHSRIGRALEMTFHPFSANFFEILDGHFSWQAQYLVNLDYEITFHLCQGSIMRFIFRDRRSIW